MDLCSRRIIGWSVSATMKDDLTLAALDQALAQRRPGTGVLHHADRGSQYSSDDYLEKLRERGFKISNSRKGDCWDNAPMESFFSTLKFELGGSFSSRAAARAELFESIEVFYNRDRMHTSIGDQSPAQFEATPRRPGPSRQPAMEADAPVEIGFRFPPSLGQRSALPTAPTAATTTTTMDLN
jgi:transposase InsO family protein